MRPRVAARTRPGSNGLVASPRTPRAAAAPKAVPAKRSTAKKAVKVAAPTSKATGEDTRARILEAALETIREVGIAGVSARSIARIGGFNQALIFYHFGSVEGLLVAASEAESRRRSELYADRLAGVSSFPELVSVARALHEEERRQGSIVVLSQMLAGTVTSPELRDGLKAGFQPWMDLVEEAVERVLAATPIAGLVPSADLAFAISSLFLGAQLLIGLEPDDRREQELFKSLDLMAGMVDMLVKTLSPTT